MFDWKLDVFQACVEQYESLRIKQWDNTVLNNKIFIYPTEMDQLLQITAGINPCVVEQKWTIYSTWSVHDLGT